MSTTDELLEEMLEDVEEYATPVTDDDLQFWIDEHLRVISIPKNGVVAGVEGDKNVNKIKFGMNRYYHGFDMSTFSGRILYSNAKGNKNYYNITDMQASGSAITFSWLVDADAVQYMGKTAFVVYLFKIQGSELRQKFYSTLATLKVLEGMEVDSAVPVEKQTDIIERMKEEISAYAEEVKKSLPADYTAMTEQVSSLKEDLADYYPKKQGAFKCVNMVSNLSDEVIMPSGLKKSILDGVCVINGTSTIDYPNLIIKKSILANHVYLFTVKMKENEISYQSCSLITRIGTKPITRTTLGEYPVHLFEYKNYSEYTTFCALFSHNSDADADFSISFDLTKTSKKVAISAKDFIITDVTGLSDIQITEIVKTGMKDGVYYNPGKNVADSLSNQAKEDITSEAIKKMYPNPNGYWYGKKCLILGDSTSATEQWQKKLSENLGMSVTTHAKGGIQFLQMVVGSLGYEGDYDNETGNTGVLQPLKISDVYDKNLIIIFGGFNNRGMKLGEITDLYKTDGTGQNTVTGQLQFVLNWIYDLLKGNESYAQNLKCKIVIVTPYCCGKYNYANYDGYSGDNWAGYTLREMCDRIIEIAALNNCSSYNAWENSGIGRHTWTIYSASPTATKEAGSDTAPYPTNADQLHLNDSVGYPHLGDCISAFVNGIV